MDSPLDPHSKTSEPGSASRLNPLSVAPTQAFISDSYQVAEIIEWIVAQIPSSVVRHLVIRQSTFSISEEFIRRIYRIKRDTGARFILAIDRKALQKTRQLWSFIANVYDEIYLADTHAKVILINDFANSFKCSVITSQNLTRGNRHESSLITVSNDIFESLSKDFNSMIKFHSVPMHEVMPNINLSEPQHPLEPQSVESQISSLAEIFMPISDIATIIEIDPAEMRRNISDESHPWARAYKIGKAKAKAAIRAQEMQLARLGSPLGVQNVRDNLIDMEAEE